METAERPRPLSEALRPRPSVPPTNVAEVQQRVVQADRPRRLVCRWFAALASGGTMKRTNGSDTPLPREMTLPKPDEGGERVAMAASFRSWQLLQLPLCREAMAELSAGKSSLRRRGAKPAPFGAAAARLLHVQGGHRDEDGLPPCDEHSRIDGLVAVSRTAWPSSADVAKVLVANLPKPDMRAKHSPSQFKQRDSGRASWGLNVTGDERDDIVSKDPRNNKSFTVVRIQSRDMEAELLRSPYPKPYPDDDDDGKKKRVSIDDGFYSSYRQYCALSQRAFEISQQGTAVFQSIGESFAGRDIYALRIFGGGSGIAPDSWRAERRVLILGGQHAREWISPAAVTFAAEAIAAKLAEASQASRSAAGHVSSTMLQALDRVEVVFVPVVNPDGYERTYASVPDQPADRFWRKNTRPTGEGRGCVGVDLNRNWGVAFGADPGSTSDECSDTYRGPEAFSEFETDAIKRFSERNPVTVTLDVHSYGNVIAGPWGHTDDPLEASELPAELVTAAAELGIAVATAASNAAAAGGGAPYSFCTGSCNGLGLAGGVAQDYFTGSDKVGFTMELRSGMGGGLEGFVLPEGEIAPTGREVVAALEAVLEYIASPAVRDRVR